MAIVVVAILMAAISPVIVLSVATRVQARRVELATQAARTYIDGVRSGAIPQPPLATNAVYRSTSQSFLESVAVPTSPGSFDNCSANSYCTTGSTQVYCIDGDSDNKCNAKSSKDFAVQAFRSTTVTSPASATVDDFRSGYRLGVRVYRADAFRDTTTLKAATKAATFAGGFGDRKAPMVEMTTDINSGQTTFRDFCDRLGCP